jgi:gamma-glutamyltranspeptidase
MSSMSPTLVLKDGLPYLTAGSPGGSRIPGTVLNVMLNFLHYNMSLADAVASPRIVSRNTIADVELGIMSKSVLLVFVGRDARFTCLDWCYSATLVAQLHSAGFQMTSNWGPRPLGFAQAIHISRNTSSPTGRFITAVADITRQPTAAAFAL